MMIPMEFKKQNLTLEIEETKAEFKKSQTEKNLTLEIEEKVNTIKAKQNYHSQGLKQAQIGFYFGLVGSFIGFVVIILALIFAEDKIWGAISGIVIEAVSFLVVSISDKAIDRMGKFFQHLGDDSNKIKAIDLSKEIKNVDIRDELSVKLALFLAGINEEKICKHTKEVCEKVDV